MSLLALTLFFTLYYICRLLFNFIPPFPILLPTIFSLHSNSISFSPPLLFFIKTMDRRRRKIPKVAAPSESEEVSSIEWEFINMSEQEEDLIYRMYRLVGDRWDLIAGRVPGRKPEEIERYWIMRNRQGHAHRGKETVENENAKYVQGHAQ